MNLAFSRPFFENHQPFLTEVVTQDPKTHDEVGRCRVELRGQRYDW